MILGFVTLFVAFALAVVAAWFSIAGLMSIFSAGAISVAIMAGTLELAKLVIASWLYRHWHSAALLIKLYLSAALLVLMVITSMGIFGYLSKAHLDQSAGTQSTELLITQIRVRMEQQQQQIQNAKLVVSQLDQTVQTLVDYDRIRGPQGAIAVRQQQAPEREQMNAVISEASARLLQYQSELLPLQQQQLLTEIKVGPLRYVAEFIYGDSAPDVLHRAVRLFIILLVVVFDPLAVIMVVAGNHTLMLERTNTRDSKPKRDTALQNKNRQLANKIKELESKLQSQNHARSSVGDDEKITQLAQEVERLLEELQQEKAKNAARSTDAFVTQAHNNVQTKKKLGKRP